MKRFLIDANLPRRVPIWQSEKFVHVVDIDDEWTDSEIWDYARKNDCTIVTKDADFSNRIIVSVPPPRIIHLRTGNMRLRDLIVFIEEHWEVVRRLSATHKLVSVYVDRVETVASGLDALGATIEPTADGMGLTGGARLRGTTLHSHDDHRLAMAWAVAGLVAHGETRIEGADAVAVSYPDFWVTLERISRQ